MNIVGAQLDIVRRVWIGEILTAKGFFGTRWFVDEDSSEVIPICPVRLQLVNLANIIQGISPYVLEPLSPENCSPVATLDLTEYCGLTVFVLILEETGEGILVRNGPIGAQWRVIPSGSDDVDDTAEISGGPDEAIEIEELAMVSAGRKG